MPEVNAIMSSEFIRVKIVAFVHFIFIGCAMLGIWLPGAFIFYNLLFMIALFWTIHCKESADAVCAAFIIDACSIIFDLACIIAFFGYMNGWVVAFAIMNLIIRPISVLLLHREFTERGGNLSTTQIFPTTTQRDQRSYEDIDQPHQSIPTNTQAPNVASIF